MGDNFRMARKPRAIRNKRFVGLATVHPFGQAKSIVFDEARSRPETLSMQGQLTIGTPVVLEARLIKL